MLSSMEGVTCGDTAAMESGSVTHELGVVELDEVEGVDV